MFTRTTRKTIYVCAINSDGEHYTPDGKLACCFIYSPAAKGEKNEWKLSTERPAPPPAEGRYVKTCCVNKRVWPWISLEKQSVGAPGVFSERLEAGVGSPANRG